MINFPLFVNEKVIVFVVLPHIIRKYWVQGGLYSYTIEELRYNIYDIYHHRYDIYLKLQATDWSR